MQLFDTEKLEVRDLLAPETIRIGEERVLSGLPPLENPQGRYQSLPLLHATTAERALSIIKDSHILSHRTLSERGEPFLEDTRFINTDELDKTLGLDRFVFLSLGRMAPRIFELSDDIVIFIIDPRSIDSASGAFYSLREICEFGATVSQEGANEKLLAGISEKEILDGNIQATSEFYNSLISAQKFGEFFDRFIVRFGVGILDYLSRMTYPGEDAKEETLDDGLKLLLNYWQGFQCMVPDKVSVAESVKIVCTSSQTRKAILDLMPTGEVATTDFLRKQLPNSSRIVMNERFITLMCAMWHNRQLRSK